MDHLCVLNESELRKGRLGGAFDNMREWYVMQEVDEEAEVAGLIGRPVKHFEPSEGLYVDEEGNVYQLKDKGETQPIAVEHLPGTEKTELESLLEASLNGEKTSGQTGGPKAALQEESRQQPETAGVAGDHRSARAAPNGSNASNRAEPHRRRPALPPKTSCD